MWCVLLSPLQVERNLHDAMEVARNILVEPYLLPGGGAAEMALAQASQKIQSAITLTTHLIPPFIHLYTPLAPPPPGPSREGQECNRCPTMALPCRGEGSRSDSSYTHSELWRQLHSCPHSTQGEWVERCWQGRGRGRGRVFTSSTLTCAG